MALPISVNRMASCESGSDCEENVVRGVQPYRFEPRRSRNDGEEHGDVGE